MKQMKKKTEQPNNIKRKNIFPLLFSQITMVYSTLLHYIISPQKKGKKWKEKIEKKNTPGPHILFYHKLLFILHSTNKLAVPKVNPKLLVFKSSNNFQISFYIWFNKGWDTADYFVLYWSHSLIPYIFILNSFFWLWYFYFSLFGYISFSTYTLNICVS